MAPSSRPSSATSRVSTGSFSQSAKGGSFCQAGMSKEAPRFWVQYDRPGSAGRARSTGASSRGASPPRMPRSNSKVSEVAGDIVPAQLVQYLRGQADGRASVFVEIAFCASSYYLPHHKTDNYRHYFDLLAEQVKEKLDHADLDVRPCSYLDDVCKAFPRCISYRREWNKWEKKGIWDQYTAPKNKGSSVPSNVSHSGGPPSRLGAFEVHLISDKGHQLLHSKLWSRHWPSVQNITDKLLQMFPVSGGGHCDSFASLDQTLPSTPTGRAQHKLPRPSSARQQRPGEAATSLPKRMSMQSKQEDSCDDAEHGIYEDNGGDEECISPVGSSAGNAAVVGNHPVPSPITQPSAGTKASAEASAGYPARPPPMPTTAPVPERAPAPVPPAETQPKAEPPLASEQTTTCAPAQASLAPPTPQAAQQAPRVEASPLPSVAASPPSPANKKTSAFVGYGDDDDDCFEESDEEVPAPAAETAPALPSEPAPVVAPAPQPLPAPVASASPSPRNPEPFTSTPVPPQIVQEAKQVPTPYDQDDAFEASDEYLGGIHEPSVIDPPTEVPAVVAPAVLPSPVAAVALATSSTSREPEVFLGEGYEEDDFEDEAPSPFREQEPEPPEEIPTSDPRQLTCSSSAATRVSTAEPPSANALSDTEDKGYYEDEGFEDDEDQSPARAVHDSGGVTNTQPSNTAIPSPSSMSGPGVVAADGNVYDYAEGDDDDDFEYDDFEDDDETAEAPADNW
eukprot:TRINITY_DN48953_c0_g1_i1.p1 TRINITY_DN48953_c0_g1~~TRINITY_DN48953_c0_g1_i1.p1  ORF type:complete len:736 (+),score=134.22 TRINITY_DN48953_c0_g1_i1:70-2277(+)